MARTKGTARKRMFNNRNVVPAAGLDAALPGESGGTDIMGSLGSFLPYVGALAPLAAMFSQSAYLLDSVKFFVIGAVLESLRRVCMWVIARFRFRTFQLSFSGTIIDKPLFPLSRTHGHCALV
jgi:hypothetical protein